MGIVMERYNWFPGAQNTFRGDARMPTALIGQIAATLGVSNLPLTAIVETYSEPPFATIGLGTGTMASYARPYQHMTYYEIDDVIREFSLPKEGKAHFTYLQNAIRRGVNMEVIMGDARQSMGQLVEKSREDKNKENSFVYAFDFDKKKFHEPSFSPVPVRKNYYRVINVDAFSSDAIPVHLCTKQALALYMDKLTPDGVLCMHTSNRHMDLVVPVARIALELSKESVAAAEKQADELRLSGKERDAFVKAAEINCRVGKDRADRERYMGHFSSEYVMVYRGDYFSKYVDDLRKEKSELIKAGKMQAEGRAPDGRQILNADVDWYDPYTEHTTVKGGRLVQRPVTKNDSLWTDDYSYILGVLR
jgi:hypothetical protein